MPGFCTFILSTLATGFILKTVIVKGACKRMKDIYDLLVSSDTEANDIALGLLEVKPIHFIEAVLTLLKNNNAPATAIYKVENLLSILK